MVRGSDLIESADRYGYAVVGLSQPRSNGRWEFGNSNVVNFQQPQPCTRDDAPQDIPYLETVFQFLMDNASTFGIDASALYASGFSQNSMFAAYAGFCFPNNVKGIWQGGSGLAITGEPPFLPNAEGQCSTDAFEQFGERCIERAPCTACAFWPIFPCHHENARPMVECVAAYENDDIVFASPRSQQSTAKNMFDALRNEGHDARLLRFRPDARQRIRGGHSEPRNMYAWLNGCLGLSSACSSACEASFATCVADRLRTSNDATDRAFAWCEARELGACAPGCAPTEAMLMLSEPRTLISKARGQFGSGNDMPVSRPGTSKCQSARTAYN